MSLRFPPLRNLKIPVLQALSLKYSPEVAPWTTDVPILKSTLNPKHDLVRDRYIHRSKDALHWAVIANVSVKAVPKAVLRVRLRRRWTSAFTEALKLEGYRTNGKRLRDAADGEHRPDLVGTLEIYVYGPQGLHKPFKDLIRTSGTIVRALKAQQNRPRHHHQPHASPHAPAPWQAKVPTKSKGWAETA